MFINSWSRWLKQLLRPAPRRPIRSRQSTTRQLHIEVLEDRTLPTIIYNPVFGAETTTQNNGAVLAQPEVVMIFWGSEWAGSIPGSLNATGQALYNAGLALINSPYVSGTTEYGTAGLAYTNPFVLDASDPSSTSALIGQFPSVIPSSDIANEAKSAANAAALPPSGFPYPPLYVVITPPGVSTSDGPGIVAFNGVSGSYPYAWVSVAQGSLATMTQQFALDLGDEIIASMTDPDNGGYQVSPPSAFAQAQPGLVGNQVINNEGEFYAYQYQSNDFAGPLSVWAQPYWSNDYQAYIIPDGNSVYFNLNPIWNGNNFTGTYNLVLNPDQNFLPGVANNSVTIGTDAGGGLQVTMDGQTDDFAGMPITGITVQMGPQSTAGDGDTVNVNALPAGMPLSVNLGGGANTVNISPTAENLNTIQSSVTITRAADANFNALGTAAVNIDDQNFSGPTTYTMTDLSVARPGAGAINVSAADELTLNGGSNGGDTYQINGTEAQNFLYDLSAPPTVTVNTGSNGGIINVQSVGASSSLNLFDNGQSFVNVQSVPASSSLTIFSGPTDYIDFGNPSPLSSIAGNVEVEPNPLINDILDIGNVTLDDSADKSSQTFEITALNVNNIDTFGELASLTLVGSAAGDTWEVYNTQAATTSILSNGPDKIEVGSPAYGIDDLHGPLNIASTEIDSDTVNLNDQPDTTAQTVTVTDTSVTFASSSTGTVVVTYGFSGMPTFPSEVTDYVGALNINTGSGGDTINVESTQGDYLARLGLYSILRTTTTTINSGGADTITVGDANGVQDIEGKLVVNAVAVADSDTLTLDDESDTTARIVKVTNSSITGLAPAEIDYGLHALASLVIEGGTGGNIYNINSTAGPFFEFAGGFPIFFETTTTIECNGADTVLVGDASGVQDIDGPLVLEGDAGAAVPITLDDSNDPTPQNVTITDFSVTGLAPAEIDYGGLDYPSAFSDFGIMGGSGGDTWNVHGTSRWTTIISGGSDTFNVGGTATGMAPLIANLSIETAHSFHGHLQITLDDQGDTTAHPDVTINDGEVSGLAQGNVIYTSLAQTNVISELDVEAGSGGTAFNAFGTPGTATVRISAQGTGNSITGSNSPVDWQIAPTGDFLSLGPAFGNMYFSGIQQLNGGGSSDDFQFLDGQTFDGSIDGGADDQAGGNTLDFSQFGSPVTVAVTGPGTIVGLMGTATPITGIFNDITDFIGSAGSTFDANGYSGDFTSSVSVSGFPVMQMHIRGNFTGQLNAPTEGTADNPISSIQIDGFVSAAAMINVNFLASLDVGGDMDGTFMAGGVDAMVPSLQSLMIGGEFNSMARIIAPSFGSAHFMEDFDGLLNETSTMDEFQSLRIDGSLQTTGIIAAASLGSLEVQTDLKGKTVFDGLLGSLFVGGNVNGVVEAANIASQSVGGTTDDNITMTPTPSVPYNIAPGDVVGLIQALDQADGIITGNPITITLAPGSTYALTTPDNYYYGPNGLPAITSNITINGNGATIERVGSTPFRIFFVSGPNDPNGLPAGQLTLENLTVEGGLAQGGNGGAGNVGGGGGAGLGGAILNEGSLSLNGVTLTQNAAQGGDGGQGGALFLGGGGGAGLGGAVFNMFGHLSVTNSTLAANSALGGASPGAQDGDGTGGSGFGAAIFNLDGTATLVNDTLTGNHVVGGDGDSADGDDVYNLALGNLGISGPTTANVSLTNDILAGTGATDNAFNDSRGGEASITVSGTNLIQQAPGNSVTVSGNVTLITGDPLLGPLQNNGGPTPTMEVLAGSPLLQSQNYGTLTGAPVTDQRGVSRGNINILGAYQATTPTQLAVTGFPNIAGAGSTNSFAVTAEDPFGKTIYTDNSDSVSVAATDPLATFAPASATLSNGVASFQGTLDTAGVQAIYATATTSNGAIEGDEVPIVVTPATSAQFAPAFIIVSGGSAQSTTVGTNFAQPLMALVTSQQGVPLEGVTVTFTIEPNNGAGGNFAGATFVTAVSGANGLATAMPVVTANDTVGTYTVVATAGGAASATFDLTNLPGVKTQLSIWNVPATMMTTDRLDFQVDVNDGFMNIVNNDHSMITATITGPGSFMWTRTMQASDGLAGFSDLPMLNPGVYTLTVGTPGSSGTISNFTDFTVQSNDSIAATLGASQSAVVGAVYAQPLEVQVTDALGIGVSGVPVTFTVNPSGGAGGSFTATTLTVNTDANGYAVIGTNATQLAPDFTANNTVGAFTVTATSPGVSGSATFNLDNTPNLAANIDKISGDNQSTFVGQPFPDALVVQITDANGNPLNGVPVTFLDPTTGASTSPAIDATVNTETVNGVAGIAEIPAPTANTIPGSYSVGVSVAGIHSAYFELTNLANGLELTPIDDSTPQSTTAGYQFGVPLALKVTDSQGDAAPGVTVTYTAPTSGPSGTFPNGLATYTAVTDASGMITLQNAPIFTANATPSPANSSYTITASADNGAYSTTFSMTNNVDAPKYLNVTGGDEQKSAIGTAFAVPMQVYVTDLYRNPLSGVPVTFTAPAGGATGTFPGGVSTVTVDTVNGYATAPAFTANFVQGAYYVTASVSGLTPYYFTEQNIDLAASIAFVSDTAVSATVNTLYPTLSNVKVADAHGQPVANAAVTFAVAENANGAGPTGIGSQVVLTNSSGIATTPQYFANYIAGGWQLIASVANVSLPATLNITNNPGKLTQLVPAGGTSQAESTGVGAAFAALEPVPEDAFDNPIPNVRITLTAPANTAGHPTALFGTATTTAVSSGTTGRGASATPLANDVEGSYSVIASAVPAGSTAPVTLTYSLSNANAAAYKIVAVSGTPQSSTVGEVFAGALEAEVEDRFNNPVPNVSVTFTVPTLGPSGTFAGGATTVTDVTNAQGIAIAEANNVTTLTAGTVAGTWTAQAKVAGVATPADFALTNKPGAATYIDAVDTFEEQTVVATAYSPVLAVVVKDGDGNPVGAGVPVTFGVLTSPSSAPSGTFTGGLTTVTENTNAQGIATPPTFTANTIAGYFNVVVSATGASASDFELTNLAGAAAKVAVLGSATASATVGAAFAPLDVTVTDRYGNNTPGAVVTFTVHPATSGAKATFANNALTATAVTTFITLDTPVAEATAPTLTAGTLAGAYTLVASVPNGITSATFTLTNSAGAPHTVSAYSGSNQETLFPLAFSTPLVAKVVDADGNPVPGATVTFTVNNADGIYAAAFSGQAETATAITNASGLATAPTLTSLDASRTFTVTPSITGATTASSFTNLQVEVLDPVVGPSQSAVVGHAFAKALYAVVTLDQKPVAHYPVTFTAPATGPSGTFGGRQSATVYTNASGIATAPAFTANTRAGSYNVTVNVNGVAPETIAMTNLAGPPAKLTALPFDAAAIPGELLGGPQVEVTDAFGNPLSGIFVAFTIAPGVMPAVFTTGQSSASVASTNGIATAPDIDTHASPSVPTDRVAFTITATIEGIAGGATFTFVT